MSAFCCRAYSITRAKSAASSLASVWLPNSFATRFITRSASACVSR